MKYKALKDIATITMGQSPDSSSYNEEENGIPFYQGNADFGELYPTAKVWCDAPKKTAKEGDILISIRAPIGSLNYATEECCIGRGLAAITIENEAERNYVFHLLKAQNKELNNKGTGSTFKAIGKSVLEYVQVPVISAEQQELSMKLMDTIEQIIRQRKQELAALDELIKARFVELFGDPLINSQGLSAMPMTDVCEIIDGDRGKNYPTADDFSDEGYCLFLNAKNVTTAGFNFDSCMFVSKEKDDALRKGKLTRGDVVLTTRGTLGNLAFYTDEIPYENIRINSGMVILRMKEDVVDEVYFIEQFKMQLADIKAKIASGSAQPQLPISTMNKIKILIPDIEKQHLFAIFVQQVNKSKVAVQKALDETQLLFNSLMQEYFG